jgi:hypothetical protein
MLLIIKRQKILDQKDIIKIERLNSMLSFFTLDVFIVKPKYNQF